MVVCAGDGKGSVDFSTKRGDKEWAGMGRFMAKGIGIAVKNVTFAKGVLLQGRGSSFSMRGRRGDMRNQAQ